MRGLNLMLGLVLLAYPFVINYGLNEWGLHILAPVVLVFLLLRLAVGCSARFREFRHLSWILGVGGLLLVSLGALFRREGWLLFYPVMVNGVWAALFGVSLRQSKPLVERFARLEEPDLSPEDVAYTRGLTVVWCVVLAANGLLALITCFLPRQVWMIYNGVISYLLLGTLFFGERLLRGWRRKRRLA